MMATAGLGVISKGTTTTLPFRTSFVYCARQVRRNGSAAVLETLSDHMVLAKEGSREVDYAARSPSAPSSYGGECMDGPEWKRVSSKELGITNSMISKPTRSVLNGLKKKGFQVYLVGGCVRDLILKRIPKDFDIITSANLHQVMRTFSRCQIIGRRFPICHVHVNDTIIEVSSFKTSARNSCQDLTYLFKRPSECDELDYMRWTNCLRRDFTINGLIYELVFH